MATGDLGILRDEARTLFNADAALKSAGRTLLFGTPLEAVSRRPAVSLFITSQDDQSDFGTPHTDHEALFVIGSKNANDAECLVIARELYRVFHEKSFTFGVTGAGLFWSQGIDQPELVDGAFEMTARYGLGVTWG